MKNFKKIMSLLLVLVMAFALVACSNINVNPTEENKLMSMKYIGIKIFDPVYVGIDKGFFEKHGLELELVDTVTGGPTALQMLESGDANGCISSTMAVINAVNQGMSVIGVNDIQTSFEEAPLEEFFVRADSGIKTVEDLKGKKIAINLVYSSFHYTWLMALEAAGMSEDDVEFVTLPFENQLLALEQGAVDAIGVMAPYSAEARANEKFAPLYDATDIFGEKQFSTIVINSKWAEKNPEVATAFSTALAETCEWIMDNQEEAKQIVSKYTGVSADKMSDYYFHENGMVIEADAEYWLAYMRSINSGISSDLTAKDIVTNKYNAEVD